MVAPDEFREAMRHLASSVCIVTTELDGEWIGCTATAMCSLSDSPPSLLVCLNQQSQTGNAIFRSGNFCVNVLTSDSQSIASRFAKSSGLSSKFDRGEWMATTGMPPQALAALVSFHCYVDDSLHSGTHYLFIGRIVKIILAEQASGPLLYANGTYGTFSSSISIGGEE
jgi:flavin reductase (DIM6/NTAB) family NADH-FMN oxidoreductase RutF